MIIQATVKNREEQEIEYAIIESGMVCALAHTRFAKPFTLLENVITIDRYRRMGYMRFLLGHIMNLSRNELRLRVYQSNSPAVKLYDSLGFVVVPDEAWLHDVEPTMQEMAFRGPNFIPHVKA